jgi:hypothetical protein
MRSSPPWGGRGAAARGRAVVVVIALLVVPAAAGADCPQLVGAWPFGPATAAAASGSYAFYGAGTSVGVADVSDPSAPQAVASVWVKGIVHAIALQGSLAFVAAGRGGLQVIDVSNPLAPVPLGSVPPPQPYGEALSVAVAGSYAYLAVGDAGMQVFDVSNPAAPAAVGAFTYPALGPRADAVAVSGSVVYLGDRNFGGGLRVLDVSSPSQPVEVTLLTSYAKSLAVSGNYLLAAGWSGGLEIYDITDPGSPAVAGVHDPGGFIDRVTVANGLAYAAFDRNLPAASPDGRTYGLAIVDFSTPSAPVEVGTLATALEPVGIAVAGTTAFLAIERQGLRVADVSTPSAPVEVGSLATPGVTAVATASGSYAYVGGYQGADVGMWVFDVADPAAPQPLVFLPFPSRPRQIVVAGSHAYVAIGSSLQVVDVSVPAAPTVVGTWDEDLAFLIALQGEVAYLSDTHLVHVLDVSDPTSPQTLATLGDWFYQLDAITLANGYLYAIDEGYPDPPPPQLPVPRGMWTFDVTTPTAPFSVGFQATPIFGLVVGQGQAYGAGYPYTLCDFDLADPAHPASLGCFPDPVFNRILAVDYADGYVYGADNAHGLAAFDTRPGPAPHAVGGFDPGGAAAAVAVAGDRVYLSPGDAGFFVLRGCSIFHDGFESAGTDAWSQAIP